MIGIIGAMEEEVAAIKEYMEITETRSILDCTRGNKGADDI